MRINREKFAVALIRKGMTAKQVAQVARISNTSIYNIKNGLQCSNKMGNRIARALGVDVADLMESEH